MMNFTAQSFDCQLYVAPRGKITLHTAKEPGPRRVITLQPIEYDDLVDVSFRNLLATFHSVPQPLAVA